uniref:Tropomyosin beta chain-like n=1 Tax=Nicotiana sylvestris TaxID=4096 RepID=A0A1U7VPJ2_NICSY|nr:PREDICTED: tropomyosin beta chain-like [Nicotiana sylvestris]
MEAGITIQETFESAGAEIEPSRHEEVDERALVEAPKPEGGEATLPQARKLRGRSGMKPLKQRKELNHLEAEVRDLTEKRDTYSEKLQAELEAAQRVHAEMAEQAQVDTIQAEAEEFMKNMDLLASKKEAVQAQLELSETQLRDAKEKTLVQDKKIEELQSQLDSAISGKENLAKELEAAKSEVVVTMTEANGKVAQYKVDVKNAKAEEARAWKLAFPEEDSKSLSESEGGEDPEDEDVASDEDWAT